MSASDEDRESVRAVLAYCKAIWARHRDAVVKTAIAAGLIREKTQDDYTLYPSPLAEEGRRLASQRDDLIAKGADPSDLETPIHPDDQE